MITPVHYNHFDFCMHTNKYPEYYYIYGVGECWHGECGLVLPKMLSGISQKFHRRYALSAMFLPIHAEDIYNH